VIGQHDQLLIIVCVQNTTNCMTFLTLSDTIAVGLPWVNMINRANKKVIPSVYSVQAAMAQFSANYSAGNLTIDVVDAPGDDSWPLTYMTYVSINRSITALDCTNIEELMRFIAWTQINDAYTARPPAAFSCLTTTLTSAFSHTMTTERRAWSSAAAMCPST
jgi:hypothetical protein